MPSNFSGYSLASTASPPAATAIPTERRPLRISMAPAPIDPNTTAFFQFCMFTSGHSEPRSAKRLHCSGSSVAPASADHYVEHYEKTAGGRISLARPERFELPAYCSGGLAARQINDLAQFAWSEIRLYLCGFLTPALTYKQAATNNQWAQNWAHSSSVASGGAVVDSPQYEFLETSI